MTYLLFIGGRSIWTVCGGQRVLYLAGRGQYVKTFLQRIPLYGLLLSCFQNGHHVGHNINIALRPWQLSLTIIYLNNWMNNMLVLLRYNTLTVDESFLNRLTIIIMIIRVI